MLLQQTSITVTNVDIISIAKRLLQDIVMSLKVVNLFLFLGIVASYIKVSNGESYKRYPYASYYDIKTLPDFGCNPENPLDAIIILEKNKVPKINLYGAFHGLNSLMVTYNMTLTDLAEIDQAPTKCFVEFSAELKNIWEYVLRYSIPNAGPICQNIKEYASTPNSQLQCHILDKNLNFHKIEYLNNDNPKIALVHNYFEESELMKWKSKCVTEDFFHMKSLYDNVQDESDDSEEEEFEKLLHFKREGKIAFIKHDDVLVPKSEAKLFNLLQELFQNDLYISSPPSFEHYQASTYGIGGSVEEHLDSYGKDIPMEDLLDMSLEDVRNQWKGDRLITSLGFIQGSGATTFSNLDITVPFVKGNLLIWQNLDSNLMPIPNSVHAGENFKAFCFVNAFFCEHYFYLLF